MEYQNMRTYGYRVGVHKSPRGYQHPWLAVCEDGTVGCWTRADARRIVRAGTVLAA